MSGSIACKKAEEKKTIREWAAGSQSAGAAGQEGFTIKEGVNDLSGTVKSSLGKYFYISQHPGFDIAASGSGGPLPLKDKDVKVKAFFKHEIPSLLIAQSIEVKEENGQYKKVFTAAGNAAIPEDFFDQKMRGDYQELKITNILKSEDWENKGKGKVYGKPLAGADGKVNAVSILDDKGKEFAKVIVDNMTEYANYYISKLRLFDTYWFYLNIKESVDKKLRPKNKELFHADIVFCGLY
jgi:hypothetical protein